MGWLMQHLLSLELAFPQQLCQRPEVQGGLVPSGDQEGESAPGLPLATGGLLASLTCRSITGILAFIFT